jgi:hypothetical protein
MTGELAWVGQTVHQLFSEIESQNSPQYTFVQNESALCVVHFSHNGVGIPKEGPCWKYSVAAPSPYEPTDSFNITAGGDHEDGTTALWVLMEHADDFIQNHMNLTACGNQITRASILITDEVVSVLR